MTAPITVHCPSCDTGFPVDPDKVPDGGVRARCSVCQEIFPVDAPADKEPDFDEPGLAVGEAEAEVAEPEADEVGAGFGDVDLEEPEADVDEAEPGVEEAEEAAAEGFEMDPDVADVADEEAGAGEDDDLELQSDQDFFGGGQAGETAVEEPPAEAAEPEVEDEAAFEEPTVEEAEPEVQEEEAEEEAPSAPAFGQRTPEQKAKRLARVLVSDMISYNPELHQKALERGTLKEDFEEEIEKSWEEYVEQVGEELADSTTFWTEALNEILAEGEEIFEPS